MEAARETARGLHAVRVLAEQKGLHARLLDRAAYDSYLPWFEKPIPALIKAWDAAPSSDPLKSKLADQIATPAHLGLSLGHDLHPDIPRGLLGRRHPSPHVDEARKTGISVEEYIGTPDAPTALLQSLAAASDRLIADFGSWKTPWGDINRFQRLNGDLVQPFNDAEPSIPVGFTSSLWGSLASFGARPYPERRSGTAPAATASSP